MPHCEQCIEVKISKMFYFHVEISPLMASYVCFNFFSFISRVALKFHDFSQNCISIK